MANVDDYVSGKILEQAGQALALLKASEDSLAGSELGALMLEKAIDTLEGYKKNPLVLSMVSGKPMELCRSCPETCLCWNMEKRGLTCLKRK